MHQYYFYIILLLVSIPASALEQSGDDSNSPSPNIILIMADDLGYGELGSYGQQTIRTPNLDAMAGEGIRFTHFYAGSSVCAPSRSVLMTGRHTGHTYVRGNFNTEGEDDLPLPDTTLTIAKYLNEEGYKTAMIGKWGLGRKPNSVHGFDYSFGYLSQLEAHDYYPPYLWENEEKFAIEGNKHKAEQTYSHTVLVDKTLEYIRNHDGDAPFFLYLPYTIPHGPFNPPDNAPYGNKDWPREKKNIAAMITQLDRDVGLILQLLLDKGIHTNTVVFFTSDNGPTGTANRFFNSNGPLRGIKRDLYEGGIRVPLIVWWPETVEPGRESTHVSAAWDLFPTITDIAGLESPAGIDGISFLPELLGKEQPGHIFLYWEFYDYNWNWDRANSEKLRNWLKSRAVRYGRWKAVQDNIHEEKNPSVELYNLERDIGEKHDVADDHPGIVRKISAYISRCCNSSPYFPYTD